LGFNQFCGLCWKKIKIKLQLIVLGKTETNNSLGNGGGHCMLLYLNTNWIKVQYILIQSKFYNMMFNMIINTLVALA
jgi:hypothetical protein